VRILVVNVNTTVAMTEAIAASAKSAAGPQTEILPLTPDIGADSVEGNFESYLAAVAVMDAVTRYPDPFDAVVQAGFGEHGREGLQELLDVPVVDITEAAAHVACLLGHKYSVVTTLGTTPRRTLRPSATTSGPMPSPGMTASFIVDLSTALFAGGGPGGPPGWCVHECVHTDGLMFVVAGWRDGW